MRIINLSALLLALLLQFVVAKGQPVLNTVEKFSAGTTFTFVRADTAGIKPGMAGKNVLWDFSHLQTLAGERTGEVLLPSQTAYATLFANADIVRKTSDGSYLFLEQKADTTLMHGYRQDFANLNITYNPPIVYAINPLTYGDGFTGLMHYEYSYNGQQFVGGGFYGMQVDGYGKLVVGGKTFDKVLRIKMMQDLADTLEQSGTKVSGTKMASYRWYDINNGHPLLSYDSVVISTQNGNEVRSEITYLKNAIGALGIAGAERNAIKAVIENDKLVLEGLTGLQAKQIDVYDVAGRLLVNQTIEANSNRQFFNLPNRASAGQLFIIKVTTTTKIHTLKLGVR